MAALAGMPAIASLNPATLHVIGTAKVKRNLAFVLLHQRITCPTWLRALAVRALRWGNIR